MRRIDQIDDPTMNIHYLELFYHVAKHGGISRAVRKMPYGIQQPALSAQILRLEEDLETVLFQRRPFCLTKSGRTLFTFIEPFFAGLDEVAAQIRGTASQRLRLAASGPILRNHFPSILAAQRRKYPALKLALRETNQQEAELLLQADEIDLAITELEGKSPPGIRSSVILKLPLALMVARDSRWRNAGQFFKEKNPATFISLLAEEALSRLFQQGFAQQSLQLAPGIEVASLESMKTYVENGFGVGLAVADPNPGKEAATRFLPLPKFPKLVIGALWTGKLPAIAQTFLDQVKRQAAALNG